MTILTNDGKILIPCSRNKSSHPISKLDKEIRMYKGWSVVAYFCYLLF